MASSERITVNPSGRRRVIVTQQLPGTLWLERLRSAGCRIEILSTTGPPDTEEIAAAVGDRCDGVLGQVNENWGRRLFGALRRAGCHVYSNVAVGFDNVDLDAATRNGIAVGNTPGVLTETTAQLAVALTFAAARRTGEAERYVREGRFRNWSMTLFLGKLLWRKTVGVIGTGRIGAAYARMMVEGHKMDLVYFNRSRNPQLEAAVSGYADYLRSVGEAPVTCRRAESVEALLEASDCVSIHTSLNQGTRHLIDAERLSRMKDDAILVNTSRGPVIDEAALVAHLASHPDFRVGLDVYENEPDLAPGLATMDNAVLVPHIGSATGWSREGMATLAATNVAARIEGHPVWNRPDVLPFLAPDPPEAAPSILNAEALGLSFYPDAGRG